MADTHWEPIQAAGLRVEFEARLQVASVRHFEANGAFAQLLRDMTGVRLPDRLRAVSSTADRRPDAVILAWRSPTETVMICSAPASIDKIQVAAATMTDGCIVDQRGGAMVFSADGARVSDLFARLGGLGACPALGESLRTRLAEVAVLAVKVRPEETLLIVERSYAPHLMAAIRVTAADLAVPLFG